MQAQRLSKKKFMLNSAEHEMYTAHKCLNVNHQHASETPFKCRFAGGHMMTRFKWHLDPPTPHHLKKVKVPPLTKYLDPRML